MVRKRIFGIILCIAMVFSLTACGQQEGSSATRPRVVGEFGFAAEYVPLEDNGQSSYFSNFTLKDDFLYYSQDLYDEAANTTSEWLYECSLEDGSIRELPVMVPEDRRLDDYALGKDGDIYVLTREIYSEEIEEDGSGIRNVFLCKYDSNGKAVFEKDITEAYYRAEGDSILVDMIADEQNNIYLCFSSGVFLLSSKGEEQGIIEPQDGRIHGIVLGRDGKVYICYTNNSLDSRETVLSDIAFDKKKLGNTYHGLPNVLGSVYMGTGRDFLICDSSRVYEYTLETETYEELFSWMDHDVNGSFVRCIGEAGEESLAAAVWDWNNNTAGIVKLSEADQADHDGNGNSASVVEAIEKEEIVIGTMNSTQEMEMFVSAFNLSSDKYHVTIKEYTGNNNEISYEDAVTNLNKELISGSNCPDILDLTRLNIELLATKGAIVDLTPYLEKSSVFDKEDFLDNVLEGYTYDGVLAAIPPRFHIGTVVGKTSKVGEEMGWTVQEMMELARENPDSQLFSNMAQSDFLYYYFMFNGNTFVDWSTGECHFDSKEFRELLEFASTFPSDDEIDWSVNGYVQAEKKQADEILLEVTIPSIYEFYRIQWFPEIYGEEVTFIGFPTMDGSVGCLMEVWDSQYGITAGSKSKEGAWEVIESYLADSADGNFSDYGFPTMKDKLQEKFDRLYQLDENGERVLDENGEPIPVMSKYTVHFDDWEYIAHAPTDEEIEQMLELISVARFHNAVDSDSLPLRLIIREEAQAYFSGQKSLDEVVDIIQNRAQLYVSENS